MEINLGKIVSVKVKLIKHKTILANVVWTLERAELKWGIISNSKFGGLWVQMPKFQLAPKDYKTTITPLKIFDSTLESHLIQIAIKEYEKVKLEAPVEDDEEEINLEELDI